MTSTEKSTAKKPKPATTTVSVHQEHSHREILIILTGLMSGLFLAALDQTIVATSIRTISDDLHGLNLQAWATTAYLITSTIATPLYGKLSDLYGRRPLYLIAISIFIVGSLLSGLSQSMYQLAIFRAIQGIGAGGLFTLAMTITADLVPPRERARYQGFFIAVFGSSSILGPVIGGFFAGQTTILGITGWRWVFLVNLPVGLVSVAMVLRTLHIPHQRRDHSIDILGATTLMAGLVPLLLVAEQGREWGWTSVQSLSCYLIGALGLAAFVWAQSRIGDDALLPLKLFNHRTFRVGSLLSFVLGMGMFGGMAAVPMYLQIVQGYSPTMGGLMMLPMAVGMMTGTITTGQVMAKTGRYRIFPIVGLALGITAMLLLSRVRDDTSMWYVGIGIYLFGVALGLNMQTLVVAMQNSVNARDMGVATSAATFFRGLGGTLGTALSLSVLFNTVPEKISAACKAIVPTQEFQSALNDSAIRANPANLQFIQAIQHNQCALTANSGALQDSSFLSHLDPRLAKMFLVGFADSIHLVFLLGTLTFLVAFAIVWFLPEDKLSDHSGISARKAQADAERTADDPDADAPTLPAISH